MVMEKMKITAIRRHQWIRIEGPDTKEIFERYPRLLNAGIVSKTGAPFHII